MKVLVNGEIVTLECRINGIDCSQDLHGNTSHKNQWNSDEECFEMSVEEYTWWKEYFVNKETDEERKYEIINEHGYEAWDTAFNDNFFANDMEDEHSAMLAVFELFKQ